jgi:lipoprotein NlpD
VADESYFQREKRVTLNSRKVAIFWIFLCAFSVLAGCTSSAYRSLETSGKQSGPVRSSGISSAPSVQSRPTSATPTPPRASSSAVAARPGQYQVRQGDTLYSIAFRFGLDFRGLAAANDIDSRYIIYPGQILVLREGNVPTATSEPAPRPSVSPPANTAASPSGTNQKPVAAAPAPAASQSTDNTINQLSWVWPHNGKIVRTFNANVSDRKGVDLTGEIGDSVVAAAAGTVVYAGNGLPGYGNLIILEHSGSLLSAYAFNQELLVSELDQVSRGQAIARMGRQGDQPSLHFEIRQEGKPVDPMRFLPQR